jgi:hypothetical protein
MKGSSPVLRRLVAVSAAVLGVGLVVTACSPVKMGAAAIVGNHRITIATLDTEVTNLSRTAKLYPGTVQLSAATQTQDTLSWLVRFQINEQLARSQGISISTAQAQTALAQIYAASKSQAESDGLSNVTLNLILAANGIPPNRPRSAGTRPSRPSSSSRSTAARFPPRRRRRRPRRPSSSGRSAWRPRPCRYRSIRSSAG